MKFVAILAIFFIQRFLDVIVSIFAPLFIPYLGFFPYKEVLHQYNLPKFLIAFSNFDGIHYLLIAKNGYTTYEQAFFPLYPGLIRFLWPHAYITNHAIGFFIGLLVSNISFLLGLWIFSKYLKLIFHNISRSTTLIWSTFLFVLLFPTSFFFGALYTEGLFFLLMIATLYFQKKERYFLASVCGLLASLTRFIGVFLAIPLALSLLQKYKTGLRRNSLSNIRLPHVLCVIAPILGLCVYSVYLWITHGDPLFFLSAQWAFGANRTSQIVLLPQVIYRYLRIFLTAQPNFQYVVSLIEFTIFSFVFCILSFDLFRKLFPKGSRGKLRITHYEELGLNLFSFINLLLPTLTGTLSSIPRYALFSLSFFLYLGRINQPFLKIVIGIVFGILHIVMLAFFIQGYFVS